MEEAGDGDKNSAEEESVQKFSPFPLFPVSDASNLTQSSNPEWLSNPSFSVDVSTIQIPAISHPRLGFEEEDDKKISENVSTSYDLVVSSASESGEERRKRRKWKKKRKRMREFSGDYPRKSGVRSWIESDTRTEKDYYLDTRGDRDNLAFGCLYRMDIARYNLYNPLKFSPGHFRSFLPWTRNDSLLDVDGDADFVDRKLRSIGRYCSTGYSVVERRKDMKRVRVPSEHKAYVVPEEFIPLNELPASHLEDDSKLPRNDIFEESWEDEVLRRTREFNKKSRDFPHDDKVWLAFADFQDEIASRQPQKAAKQQTLEKKISILEKAVELNRDNEDLLLDLMKTYKRRDSTDVLVQRWEKVLIQHPDSCKLWTEFLRIYRGEFSRFKVSDTRKIYAHAIQALSAACNKQYRQGCQTSSVDPILIQLELGLVDIFINLCRFEWQTGYQELATALFQSEIEYSLFCPSLHLTEQSKQRLFEHFWNAGCARLGEDSALGWFTWLEKQEDLRRKILMDKSFEDTEAGGWTGWSEFPSSDVTGEIPEDLTNASTVHKENVGEEEDVESLLSMLGVNVAAETDTEITDPALWGRWSVEESVRDSEQWFPMHGNSGGSPKEEDEQLSRVILYEDVCEYIFSLTSSEARFSLVSQFISFFDGRISTWACTNSSSWVENTLGLENLPASLSDDLKIVDDMMKNSLIKFHLSFEEIDEISIKTSRMNFLRNAILLCLSIIPRNYILQEALLTSEELCATHMGSISSLVTPSRSLAKRLLKLDRQDLLLCGLYARSEANYGNIDLARKIFDMALSSLEGLSLDIQENTTVLFLWYAETELICCSNGGNQDSPLSRAVHILSCLGRGVKYTPFLSPDSNLQLLRARQGFRQQFRNLQSAWIRGEIKDQSIALICAAALFEDLTTGWSSGIRILEEAFSMTLPERRSQSSQLESLFSYYIKMVQKHVKDFSPSKTWMTIVHGLHIYPYNPQICAAFVQIGSLYTVPHKLRSKFDDFFNKKPSLLLLCFALSFELSKSGCQHRIRGLFERALSKDTLQKSVMLWRMYLAYELQLSGNSSSLRRIFFRAIHACPWSKKLWLDGFQKLNSILTAKELSDLHEVMRDKELNLRTDIYEILLQEEIKPST